MAQASFENSHFSKYNTKDNYENLSLCLSENDSEEKWKSSREYLVFT